MDDGAFKKGSNLPVALTLEHVSPVTRLLEKRKQMLQVQESLDAQKEEYTRKEELFKRREENLRKKDLELQEALVIFNKFLKENEHKRRRADHRAQEEAKKITKIEKDIIKYKQKLAKKKQAKQMLEQSVTRNVKYGTFLEMVYRKHSVEFDEPQSIMSRHKMLTEANADLSQNQETYTIKMEKLRAEFVQYQKDQYNNTLSLNNDIANRSSHLDAAVKAAGEVEEQIAQEEKAESNSKRNSTQIIMAVDNLYYRCMNYDSKSKKGARRPMSKKEKEAENNKMDVTAVKLGVIANYLNDFKDMVESIKGMSAQAALREMHGDRILSPMPDVHVKSGGHDSNHHHPGGHGKGGQNNSSNNNNHSNDNSSNKSGTTGKGEVAVAAT